MGHDGITINIVSRTNFAIKNPGRMSSEKVPREIGLKTRVHVKAGLTSLNTAFLPINILVTFQAMLNLSAHLINLCLAVLCKYLDDVWALWE